MTMYQFMVNAFYMLCGVACVAASVVIVYIVLNVLLRALRRGGGTSDHQSEWLDALSAQGYKAALCYGWEQAAGTIIEYLTGGGTHD